MTKPDQLGLLLASCALVTLAAFTPALAQNKSSFIDQKDRPDFASATVSPQIACGMLNSQSFADVTTLKATHVAGVGNVPGHCQVTGYIRPQVRFEITLPDNWNRRLYMFGNGGYAGEDLAAASRIATRNAALSKGFLTVQQNTGHDAVTYKLGDFAQDLDLLIDYGSRAVHVTVDTAKAIAARYYDRHPSFSYWDGCSTGGRQGLMAAQRYPGDFDGILAGAPVLDLTNTQIWGVWNARALLKAPISRAQLPVLAKAVMDKCDAIDGARDGLIADPRQCNFDPAKDLKICEAGGSDCFTPAQAETLKTLAGGVKIKGETIFPGVQFGTEGVDPTGVSGWDMWMVSDPGPSRQLAYGETFVKNMAMLPASGKAIDWKTFDFDAEYPKIGAIREIVDATNPDLSEFRKRGGRMITYFGWSDPALNPMMGVNYYEAVRKQMGAERTAEFYRLFMVPGMFHCTAGYGTDVFDAFTPLMDWVENGKAPEVIRASQMKDGKPAMTRPLCPYPQSARYSGNGDLKDGANFECKMP